MIEHTHFPMAGRQIWFKSRAFAPSIVDEVVPLPSFNVLTSSMLAWTIHTLALALAVCLVVVSLFFVLDGEILISR